MIHQPFVVTAFMRSRQSRPDESGHYEPWNHPLEPVTTA